jgi:OOP family OmpA-OmpF porin
MFKHIAAAVTLVAAASSAFAAEPQPFYAGIDVGSTKIEGFDREGGYGAFLGFKFNPNVAIEAGYHRLADTEYGSGPLRADVTVDQIAVSVIGSLPLSNGFDVYGRLGYNRLEADADAGGFSAKEHDSNALYGLGLGYSFSPVVHGRLEVQKPASDTTRILAGVAFRF